MQIKTEYMDMKYILNCITPFVATTTNEVKIIGSIRLGYVSDGSSSRQLDGQTKFLIIH